MPTRKPEEKPLEFNQTGHMSKTLLGETADTARSLLHTASNTLEIGNQASLIGLNKVKSQKVEQYYKDAIKHAVFERDMKTEYGDNIFDQIPNCPY